MFQKILIANRGEIARRIIRTAHRMRIFTVAVYSDADRESPHVREADEAVHIGPSPASESYLVIEAIIEACRRTGAEAVHPGYGFLSERAEFAERLAAAGIVFVGPNPAAIRAMGDKIQSKRFARAAGVSVVPGPDGVVESAEAAVRAAGEIGYPVMIKASAGGGGKGMRIADDESGLREGFDRARSEAASSFGDDRLFLEKFIRNPRHIEIQVLGDKHGNVIHLGERECTIQRRHQKVVEEAPSPLLDEATRERMGAEAVALARAVGYNSAGTVEFVAGQDRSFYFLEMNTRLQVEHPVTEMVTGLDLVEEMIRVAAGEPLRLAQPDVRFEGWAVESRIYAEDPARGFLPSTGRLVRYRPPDQGSAGEASVRVDTGVAEGGEISIHYDPMIAKLVTHGATREAAIAAQGRALDGFAIEGIRHNIPFLSALMRHPRWREGALSTGFIAEEFPEGFEAGEPEGEAKVDFAAVAVAIDHALNLRKRGISGQLPTRRPFAFELQRVVRFGQEQWDVRVVDERPGGVRLAIGACQIDALSAWAPGDPVWTGTVDGREIVMQVRPILNGVALSRSGWAAQARVFTRREAELFALMPEKRPPDTSRHLLCPMPGVVRAILVAEGQAVRAGEALAVVEAMKMENLLRAERDGTVAAIHAREGEILAVDAVILEFE